MKRASNSKRSVAAILVAVVALAVGSLRAPGTRRLARA